MLKNNIDLNDDIINTILNKYGIDTSMLEDIKQNIQYVDLFEMVYNYNFQDPEDEYLIINNFITAIESSIVQTITMMKATSIPVKDLEKYKEKIQEIAISEEEIVPIDPIYYKYIGYKNSRATNEMESYKNN